MATTRRSLMHLPRQLSRRTFSTTRSHLSQSPFGSGPAPPRLPKEEQEVFEKLQRQSTGAFSTPRSSEPTQTQTQTHSSSSDRPNMRIQINQSPDSAPLYSSSQQLPQSGRMQINQSPDSQPEIRFENGKVIREGEDLHPNMRRGAPPEFEGDVNPKTGEVGGPKNEPLRWGVQGDWSYNGRVTDF
ncbi:Nn.00g091780.m01.CDS01 [Neocucurbitaria sp. VM-36]